MAARAVQFRWGRAREAKKRRRRQGGECDTRSHGNGRAGGHVTKRTPLALQRRRQRSSDARVGRATRGSGAGGKDGTRGQDNTVAVAAGRDARLRETPRGT